MACIQQLWIGSDATNSFTHLHPRGGIMIDLVVTKGVSMVGVSSAKRTIPGQPFFKTSVVYLGHGFSKVDICTNCYKVKAITNWPISIMVTELWNFWMFSSYYRHFIKGYAIVVYLLYDQISSDNATHKKWKIQWIEECQEVSDMLKVLCTSTSISAFSDFTLPFKLHTDASTMGLGAILYQEQGGKDRAITYASRALSKRKSHYPTCKLEFLAFKGTLTESFQEYLYGKTFSSFSDNNPLTYVLTAAKSDATGHRWIAKLAKFNFTIY